MRIVIRNATALALVTVLLAAASDARAQTGGGGGGGSSGGGGFGGSGGGGSGSGSNSGSGVGSTTSGQIATDSILGSFDNVGRARGGAIAISNMFAPYYYNPYAQGLLTQTGQNFTPITNAGFGQALFNATSSGSSSRSGFGGTSGFGGATNSRSGGMTGGTSFGGTSIGGPSNFGSTASIGGGIGGSTGFGGGTTGLGGTAGLRSGSTSGMTFPGGAFGPSIGRTGPIIGSTLIFDRSPRIELDRRTDVQDIVARTTAITAPAGVNAALNSGVLYLRGSVKSAGERQLLENMMRLQPGVREIRNELEVHADRP